MYWNSWPEHVETRLAGHGAALVAQPARRVQAGQVDPAEVLVEAGAPDHVGHVEHLPVLVLRAAVHDARDPCGPLRRRPAGCPSPSAGSTRSPFPSRLSAWSLRPGFDRSVRMCSHTHQSTGNISRPCQPLMSMGISPTWPSGHQHLVGRRQVHRDLGAACCRRPPAAPCPARAGRGCGSPSSAAARCRRRDRRRRRECERRGARRSRGSRCPRRRPRAPAVTRKPLPSRNSPSTCTPSRTGSSNVATYRSR